jgi:hypothetical protein
MSIVRNFSAISLASELEKVSSLKPGNAIPEKCALFLSPSSEITIASFLLAICQSD